MMFPEIWRQALLALLALTFGTAISAGTFALLVTLGIIPRMVARTQTAGKIVLYENMICLGGTVGCLLSLFPFLGDSLAGLIIAESSFAGQFLAGWLLPIFGLCAGIFVGCQAVALAEILNVFPIMFRRIKLKWGLSYIMIAMALGKVAGSLFYFFYEYSVD